MNTESGISTEDTILYCRDGHWWFCLLHWELHSLSNFIYWATESKSVDDKVWKDTQPYYERKKNFNERDELALTRPSVNEAQK